MIRENVTVDSHFSSSWLDVKLSKRGSRTHEGSSDDEKKRLGRKRRRQRRGQSVVIPSCFHINRLYFHNQKELFQSIYYILWHRRASDHEFYWLFMSLFYFHRVFVPPQASSSIHPSKWVHKAKHADPKFHSSCEKSWSFTLNSSKGFLFLMWYIVSFLKKRNDFLQRGQNDSSTQTNSLQTHQNQVISHLRD